MLILRFLKSHLRLVSFVFYLVVTSVIELAITKSNEYSRLFIFLAILFYVGGYITGQSIWLDIKLKGNSKKLSQRIVRRIGITLLFVVLCAITFLIFEDRLTTDTRNTYLIFEISLTIGIFASYRYVFY